MASIDPSARVEDGAVIGEGAVIGPFCAIGCEVTVGPNCNLVGHVHVAGKTTLGANCTVYPFASLGTPPQSLTHRGEATRLEIGEGCTIREAVTMNTGTVAGGGTTRIGARGFFMANSHCGHDCVVGDDVIFANSVALGGHCEIGDNVFIGGLSAVHQFTRIGAQAMIAGVSGIRGDIIPFGFAIGQRAVLEGLNVVGMRRRKFTRQRLHTVREFYQRLFHGPGTFAERLADVQPLATQDPAIAEILTFIGDGKRLLMLPAGSSDTV